jgi:uncharacterized protein (DUF1919 family)
MSRRAYPFLAGREFSFITQNCFGARLSEWAEDRFRSPTINLWFKPDGFLTFLEDLPFYLTQEIVEDFEGSIEHGYPVGRLGEIEIFFMHYSSFDQARRSWIERAPRVRMDRIVVVMNDRDGFDANHLRRFRSLAFDRKILFTSKNLGVPEAQQIPAWAELECVGDTYGQVELLDPVLTEGLLARLTREGPKDAP